MSNALLHIILKNYLGNASVTKQERTEAKEEEKEEWL